MKMKLHINGLLVLSVLAALFASCKQNELDPTYKGISRVVISGDADQGAREDSILFSFAIFEESLQETELFIRVQTMGNLSDAQRTVQLEADPELTTALPDEYDFPTTITIPPQGFQTTIPVTIMRSERLRDAEAKLVLRVVPTGDFEPGPRVPGTQVNSGPSFNVIWNDQLTKPPFWDPAGTQSLRWVLGDWSQVKHQLIIDLTGIRDFSELTTVEKYYIQSAGLAYIAQYNAEHPGKPLLNERDEEIGFCRSCN